MAERAFFESGTKIIAIFSFSLLCLTTIHEWAFFIAVGREYQALMQPKDYLISAVYWLPIFIIGFFIFLIYEISMRRIEDFKSEDELIAPFKNQKFGRIFRRGPNWFISAILIFETIRHLVFDNPYKIPFGGAMFIVLWIYLVLWVIKHPKVNDKITRTTTIMILIASALIALTFFNGLSQGHYAMTNKTDVYILTLPKLATSKQIVLLRILDRGLLIRDLTDEKVEFYRWDNIEKFGTPYSALDVRPLPCQLFKMLCPTNSH